MPHFTANENWREIFRFAPNMLRDFIEVYRTMLIHLNNDSRQIRGITVRSMDQRKAIQDSSCKPPP